MATVTASLSISSRDIMNSALSLSDSATLTTAGTTTGVSSVFGLNTLTLTSTSKVDLITYAEENISGAGAKLYVKNTQAIGEGTNFVKVLINSEDLGRLYGGQFMFMPYSGGSGEDFEVQPSSTDSVTLEYMVVY
tara:strand:- start:4006 stop:4410 length:405 start_codon:yes stop_codon:yes gene_type:complete